MGQSLVPVIRVYIDLDQHFTLPIAIDPRDDRPVWIGLAHSADGGVTWTIEPSNMPSSILSVVFNPDGTVLYSLGRDLNVWRATLSGNRCRAIRR